MAIVEKTENAVVEIADLMVLIAVAAVLFVSYLASKNAKFPISLYPDVLWAKFADFIDGIFYGAKTMPGTSMIQRPTDSGLSKVYGWINDNLPRSANSKGWPEYEKQYESEAGASVETGGSDGVTLGEYGNGAEILSTTNDETFFQIPYESIENLPISGASDDPFAGLPEVQLPHIGVR